MLREDMHPVIAWFAEQFPGTKPYYGPYSTSVAKPQQTVVAHFGKRMEQGGLQLDDEGWRLGVGAAELRINAYVHQQGGAVVGYAIVGGVRRQVVNEWLKTNEAMIECVFSTLNKLEKYHD